MLITNWVMVSIPSYLEKIIDLLHLRKEGSIPDIMQYVAIMAVLIFSIIITRTLSRVFFFNPARKIENSIKNSLYQKITTLPKNYFDKNPLGSIISRINNDITGIRILCGYCFMQFVNISTILTFTPYKMWEISPELTLYCILTVFVAIIGVRFTMKFTYKLMKQRMGVLQGLSAFSVMSYNNIETIKSTDTEKWAIQQFFNRNEELRKTSYSLSRVRCFFMPIFNQLENILRCIILAVGGYLVSQQQLSIGEITAFLSYIVLITSPLISFGWLMNILQWGILGLKSMENINLFPSIPTIKLPRLNTTAIATIKKFPHLTVRNFSFSYDTEPILKDISFVMNEKKKTIGIFGEIGSGKTTLVNSLNGYLSIPRGFISLNDKDINDYHPNDWRSVINTTSQSPFLFSNTISYNVQFGLVDEKHVITEKEWDGIFYRSALSNEIRRFPQKKETLVGEKGVMLSGGQKQRISIARSLIRKSPILILDNVFSAVDYETEKFLLQEIVERNKEQFLLLVSHRTRILKNMDEILVLKNGEIIERGTFQELLSQKKYFFQAWQLQNEQKDTD